MSKKTTLIIGGTRGIGSVIKNTLTERGDEVYTASRSDLDDPKHFKIDLPDNSNIDLSEKLDYLVFAHRYRGPDWSAEFDVMVKSCNIIITHLKKVFSNKASIVVLGSNAGDFVIEEQSAAYHATRSALCGLVKYYGVVLGPMGIRCNALLPNTLIKPENEQFFTKENDVRKMIEEITPLRRMGTAEDIANAVSFLCSEKSSFITGQSIYVDGGLSLVGQENIARKIHAKNNFKRDD